MRIGCSASSPHAPVICFLARLAGTIRKSREPAAWQMPLVDDSLASSARKFDY
jgi:hypothetical protein